VIIGVSVGLSLRRTGGAAPPPTGRSLSRRPGEVCVSRLRHKGSATGSANDPRCRRCITLVVFEDASRRHMRQQLGWLGFATCRCYFLSRSRMATSIGAVCSPSGSPPTGRCGFRLAWTPENLQRRGQRAVCSRCPAVPWRPQQAPLSSHDGVRRHDPRAIRWLTLAASSTIAGERPIQPVLST